MMLVLFLVCALDSADCQVMPFAHFNGSEEDCQSAVEASLSDINERLEPQGIEVRAFKCVPTAKESNT